MSALERLAALEDRGAFARRHIGPSEAEIARMLAVVGVPDLDALAARTVPADILATAGQHSLDALPPPVGEAEAMAELAGLAARNRPLKSLIGMGYNGTLVPAVIQRNVLENPGWYTAYTPYQAEIAQGRLEALVNFQTMVADLTGLPIANASLLDEGTAVAEAMALALSAAKGPRATNRRVILASAALHPQTIAVLRTRAAPLDVEVRVYEAADMAEAATADAAVATVLAYPGTTGEVRETLAADIAAIQAAGSLAIVVADPLALVLLTPPGEMGADIVVGSTQRFGVPMGWGGPHAAYMAVKDGLKRLIPGRLVGVSADAAGRPAMRLALQTREQHIRREKATSNICTAQVLLAVMAGMYAVWHGAEGLRRIAERVHLQAALLADAARRAGFRLRHESFFDTVAIEAGGAADRLMDGALAKGFNLRRVEEGCVAIALDETVTRQDLVALVGVLCEAAGVAPLGLGELAAATRLPESLARRSPILTAAVFSAHRSEHAMMRYLKALEDRDIALNRSMIPLGSCTMKLNAAAEMAAVTLPGFSNVHPFAPVDQVPGYLDLVRRLERWLCAVTGFAAVSLQPNAGSQGEYAGLLAIRAYHRARGEERRDVCLIPSSAHGTNPASAAMAGMRVVVVRCDAEGNVDLDDLRARAEQAGERLAALMVTYPSTHGVFETEIRAICDLIHAQGGQVYMDGANMNAQVGLTSPAAIGADVCHLNLHKTFCIPHGGGGPGVGPIGVAAHLAPHLPNHPLLAEAGPETGVGPVSAAPFGSASILPIPYAYVRMMGASGLRRATQVAILAANYAARRLEGHYPVLYRGVRGMVAHECILDCRGFQASAGIAVEDIAKRLQDFGFHAPTMSWPVAGTLMVEPTESEPLDELERFVEAMIAIREEIRAVEEGRLDRADNPLKHAPHTAAEVAGDDWPHAYSRAQAAWPLPWVAARKYWPPVKRVDNVYGDRNLACTCAPLEAYAQEVPLAAE